MKEVNEAHNFWFANLVRKLPLAFFLLHIQRAVSRYDWNLTTIYELGCPHDHKHWVFLHGHRWGLLIKNRENTNYGQWPDIFFVLAIREESRVGHWCVWSIQTFSLRTVWRWFSHALSGTPARVFSIKARLAVLSGIDGNLISPEQSAMYGTMAVIRKLDTSNQLHRGIWEIQCTLKICKIIVHLHHMWFFLSCQSRKVGCLSASNHLV